MKTGPISTFFVKRAWQVAKAYLKGLPELRRKLERLKRDTEPHVAKAMGDAAEKICSDMRRLVPVDKGDLQDSIGWTFGEAPKGSIHMSHRLGGFRITIYAGNETAFYARWIEFGTAPHTNEGRFQGTEHPGTNPQPFFFPAYRANKKQVVLGMRRAIRDAVKGAIA